MNSQQFCDSFCFGKVVFAKEHHTNCGQAPGAPKNYIGMLIHGTGKLVTRGETLILEKGEPFFIPFGCQYHSFWYPQDGEVSWHSLGFDLLPFRNGKRPALQKLRFGEFATDCFESIVSDYRVHAGSIGALYQLLGALEDCFTYTDSRIHPIAESALEAITQNPFQSIGQVAQKCGVSESALYSTFKHFLGYSPNYARQKALCDRAIRLLETTDLPIEEISEKMGFSSSSYFRKVLRAHTDATPREIRKRSGI